MRAQFMFQPPKVEADNLRLFFERFGGYTAFVKKALNEHGYKPLLSLKEVAKRCAEADDAINKELEETTADGEISTKEARCGSLT